MKAKKSTIPALDQFPSYRFHLISKLSDRGTADAYWSALNLSLSEGRCLAAIGQYEPLSVQDLAGRANLNKANASRASDLLSERGMVVKATNQRDGRSVVLALTPQGKAFWRKTMQLIQQRNDDIFGCLSAAERDLLDTVLDRLVLHLRNSPSADGN